jgi:hypothetical protein
MLQDSPLIFSKSCCSLLKSLDVSSHWEAGSCSASQILRILGRPQFHCLSTNTAISEPVVSYEYPAHARETGLLRSTLMLSCHLYWGLPLVSSIQVFFFIYFSFSLGVLPLIRQMFKETGWSYVAVFMPCLKWFAYLQHVFVLFRTIKYILTTEWNKVQNSLVWNLLISV